MSSQPGSSAAAAGSPSAGAAMSITCLRRRRRRSSDGCRSAAPARLRADAARPATASSPPTRNPPGRPPPPRPHEADRRRRVLGDMAQRLGGAPVLPEPGERVRVIGAETQDGVGHRQQRVQIERTGAAAPDARAGCRLAGGDRLAQLAGQHPRAGEAQRPLLGRRRGRQQQEPVLCQRVDIELPGDDPGAGGRTAEGRDLSFGSADRQAMLQPVGVRQAQRRGTGAAIMPVLRPRRRAYRFLPVGERRGGRRAASGGAPTSASHAGAGIAASGAASPCRCPSQADSASAASLA